ncbi:MAG TPA: transglycosylase domain-containing protein [Ktedonobacteraceae bacterium]|jgi:penicillin-binding protein 1A|nr:transglycosylase domain-containing protein [Ktedonobacteraceae bacterium]
MADETSMTPGERAPERRPATLPEHSRAAAAQRLSEKPQPATRGVQYKAPHRGSQRLGWRVRRHLKRKSLRRSNQHVAAMERLGTQLTLLPMASIALIIFLVMSTILVGAVALVNATQQRFGTSIVTLEDILPKDSLKMYDDQNQMIYQMTKNGLQTTVPLAQISPYMINAQVAIEDQNFWKNAGFDITGIVRAAIADLSKGHVVAGGSTITQQVIKNAVVGNQDTALRKLEEMILAPDATRHYTKQQILNMYLSTTYYGEQAYGVDAAAFVYFNLQDRPGHSAASQLDLAQSALLAGMARNGILYDPFLFPRSSYARQKEVLDQMVAQGYISRVQENAAIAEAHQPNFLHRGVLHNQSAPHFINYTLRELARDLNVKVDELARAGLVVYTTLDLPLQNKVLKVAQEQIKTMKTTHNLSDAAEVVINYHTGAIKVLLGNVDPANPKDGEFDVASLGLRQPGSSFKPFIYATAFGEGLSPGMPVMDGPFSIRLCCGLPPYTPHNYDMSYHGLVTYRYALQNSFNIPAVKLLTKVGVQSALKTAQRMGITAYNGIPNYTMVLGSLGVHLLDETSAYGVFGNGGIRVPPHAVSVVKDPTGKVIYRPDMKGTRVLSPQVAYMMSTVLSDNASRVFEFGKCSSLFLYSNSMQQCYAGNPGQIRPSAVKTGTSQDFMDNWTVGYTTDLAVGVWAGNDDNSPMVNVTGVDGAGPIWHETMLLAEKGYPVHNFVNPGGMTYKTVSYPGKTTTDWYINGLSENARPWFL